MITKADYWVQWARMQKAVESPSSRSATAMSSSKRRWRCLATMMFLLRSGIRIPSIAKQVCARNQKELSPGWQAVRKFTPCSRLAARQPSVAILVARQNCTSPRWGRLKTCIQATSSCIRTAALGTPHRATRLHRLNPGLREPGGGGEERRVELCQSLCTRSRGNQPRSAKEPDVLCRLHAWQGSSNGR